MTTKRPGIEVFNQNAGTQEATFGHLPDQTLQAGSGGGHHSLASSGQGANLLIGGNGVNVFHYKSTSAWSGYAAQNVGDPGNPGPNTLFSLAGYAQNKDVFHGKAGATNILWMANGKEALFLDDGFSPGVDSLRLTNIGEIQCGTGNQIVDLTSPRFTIGNITIKGGTGNDVMMSSIGNDTIIAGKGNDYMWGGSGDDTFQWEASKAGAFTDTVIGANGIDTFKDKLTAAQYTSAVKAELTAFHDYVADPAHSGQTFAFHTLGNVSVTAVERLDVSVDGRHVNLVSAPAKQTLEGGGASHSLTGSAGADTFFWKTSDVGPGKGPDAVHNFSFENLDRLDVSRLLINHHPANLADAVNAIDTAQGLLVQVHVRGATAWTDIAVIEHVHNVTVADLVHSHSLIL